MISKKLAKWIAYHPKTVLIVCLILIIPSIIGYFLTGVNYDILSYLPENLESVQGEQILDETFHNSASSFIIKRHRAQGYPEARSGRFPGSQTYPDDGIYRYANR